MLPRAPWCSLRTLWCSLWTLWCSLWLSMQHFKPACIFPQPEAVSLSWGRPCGLQRGVPSPKLAALVLWAPSGWRWAVGNILGYLPLLMTSLSPQYASMTASLKRASTTWSSTCKCQIQGPSPSFTPSMGPTASSGSGASLSPHQDSP